MRPWPRLRLSRVLSLKGESLTKDAGEKGEGEGWRVGYEARGQGSLESFISFKSF